MKISSQEWSELIIKGAAAFGVDLNVSHARRFAIHAAELVRWNQKINITAITDPLEIAVKHFLDSLPAVRFIPPDAALLDIGSGGGFPGLPLKVLMPSISVTLIDASRKKVNFLKHVIRTLKLADTEALHIRAEDLADDPFYRSRFDVITSRAVLSTQLFCQLAWPLLAAKGVMIALKGRVLKTELQSLRGCGFGDGDAAPAIGGQLSATVEAYRLPLLNSNRSMVIIRKMMSERLL
jgi:16S rRNA (guanine527-N7)-methyltransferase